MAKSRCMRAVTFGLALATKATFIAGVPFGAFAETRIETVIGTVSGSEPIFTSYTRNTPVDEQFCEVQNIPVYGTAEAAEPASDLGAMIIGGLIGSAIGNKTSDEEGAGAAGAVVGALLAREHAKNNQGGETVVGYRQEEVCSIRTVMMEQQIEEVTGYRVSIEVDNKIISFEIQENLSAGSRIELTRETIYSLR